MDTKAIINLRLITVVSKINMKIRKAYREINRAEFIGDDYKRGYLCALGYIQGEINKIYEEEINNEEV